jgi:hypothetical protein
MAKSHTALTAPEISDLWTAFQADTLNVCGLSFFLTHAEDTEIRSVLKNALSSTKKRIEKEIDFFNGEQYPIPRGFTNEDVNLNAPKLFSDRLYLEYVLSMTNLDILANSTALAFSVRSDMIAFYTDNLHEMEKMHVTAKELMKKKGYYIRAPEIPKPDQIHFVRKDSFLSGWIGNQRPLLANEIANLIFSAKRNALGQAVITGFSQVAENKNVRQYLEKGRDISGKHYETFTNILRENYLSDGTLLTPEVTNSTTAPFSDKLMLNFVTVLIASGIGQYGLAVSSSPRHDLAVQYMKLMAEVGKYANEGANLLIDYGWMEQPPISVSRQDLAKE